MDQSNAALKVALAAVEQLPLKLQRQLAERLIAATAADEHTTIVYVQRLAPEEQARLAELLDKQDEGQLTPAEQAELRQLGAAVDRLSLANSRALARALRPELFDEQGRPVRHRFRQALRQSVPGQTEPNRGAARG